MKRLGLLLVALALVAFTGMALGPQTAAAQDPCQEMCWAMYQDCRESCPFSFCNCSQVYTNCMNQNCN